MNKVVIGLALGAALGAIDGACSWFYPEVRAVPGKVMFIAFASAGKGLLAGVVTGFIARKLHSLPLGMLAGFLVAALITLPIALSTDPDTHQVYFVEIMIPGAICGMIVGFATQRYGTSKGKTMDARTLSTSLLLALGAFALPGCEVAFGGYGDAGVHDAGLDAAQAFARMKTLAGSYDATSPDEPGPTKVSYEVTSGGHALLEKLAPGSEEAMTSMYYLEGKELVMVHYCALGNRPHLQLDPRPFDARRPPLRVERRGDRHRPREGRAHPRARSASRRGRRSRPSGSSGRTASRAACTPSCSSAAPRRPSDRADRMTTERLRFENLAQHLLLKNGNYLYKVPFRGGFAGAEGLRRQPHLARVRDQDARQRGGLQPDVVHAARAAGAPSSAC
jgi:hypothetical protein